MLLALAVLIWTITIVVGAELSPPGRPMAQQMAICYLESKDCTGKKEIIYFGDTNKHPCMSVRPTSQIVHACWPKCAVAKDYQCDVGIDGCLRRGPYACVAHLIPGA